MKLLLCAYQLACPFATGPLNQLFAVLINWIVFPNTTKATASHLPKRASKHGQLARREDKKRILLFLLWRVNHRFPRSNDGGYQRCFSGKFHHRACCSSLHWSPIGGASFITTQYLNSRIARYCAGDVFPLSMVFGYCLCWLLKVNKVKEWCCKKIGTGSEGWWIKLLLYRIGSGFLDKKLFP